MKIGLFDSGIGGISVLHTAAYLLPAPDYLYYADVQHAPYGTKDADEIRRYAEEIVSFLLEKGAECIVIACNTATSAAVRAIREKVTTPVVGMEPAVKPALQMTSKDDRVLALATPLTIREHKLEELIARLDNEHRVDLKALPKLVEFAENGVFEGDEVERYLAEELRDIDKEKYRAVVPGCTHFNFFLPALKKMFPKDTAFVDGHEGTARRIAQVTGLAASEARDETAAHDALRRTTYFFSGEEATDEKTLARIEKLHERLEEIRHGGE